MFFALSLALHAGVGWLLRELPVAPGSAVANSVPAPVQMVSWIPAAEAVERKPAPVQVPKAPPEPVVNRKPPEAVLPAARVATLPRPAPKPVQHQPAPAVAKAPAAPAPVMSEPARAAMPVSPRPVVAAAVTPAAAAIRREVFRSEPSFLTPPRPPIYPAQAKRRNQQGVVLVEVRLDEAGKLIELKLLRSSGIDSLDKSAMNAVAAWRFRAEVEDGQAVPSRIHIPIEFALTASR